MSSVDFAPDADAEYAQKLHGEGEYWDNFVAQRLRQNEMPGSVDWRLTFTQFRYNHGWRPLCLGPQGINFRMQEIRTLLLTAAPRPGLRILDLGCGAGWLSLELARRGAHVTAVDISPVNLALGRYMAETNTRNFPYLYQGFAGLACRLETFGSVEYVYGDLNTLTLPVAEYDAVVCWDSLHHVAALERLVEQVRRALKPTGCFVGVDHAFATARTQIFNQIALTWLEDLYAPITAADPAWLYEGVTALGQPPDRSAQAIDYDPTPLPGAAAFFEQLFAEMLAILAAAAPDEADARNQTGQAVATASEAESPFEDVSAERVMHLLLETFQAERFETICPLIMPEKHIPHYRHENERLFQHYLAAALIKVGEAVIAQDMADGQWFIFHLTPTPPAQAHPLLARLAERAAEQVAGARLDFQLARQGADLQREHAALLEREADLQREHAALMEREADLHRLHSALGERDADLHRLHSALSEHLDYIAALEAEVARKNAALTDREQQIRQLERELTTARAPRLPWKRRRPQ